MALKPIVPKGRSAQNNLKIFVRNYLKTIHTGITKSFNQMISVMANSFTQVYIHFVFSTKNREPLIKPEFEKQLWAYIGGIGKQNETHIITCGGMPDHAHILLELSKTMSIAQTIQKIKGVSSKWLNDHHFPNRDFAWQVG